MISKDSPFTRLPLNLDQKQAVFLDGLRHAAQIVDLSYKRLCAGLTHLVDNYNGPGRVDDFAHLFLDAWAFVDATDRFRLLWVLQPNAATIPVPNAPSTLNVELRFIRDLRNVAAHIAEKIDEIVSRNASVLGTISWLTIAKDDPSKIKTCFLRPGIIRGTVKDALAIPTKRVEFFDRTGCIFLSAGRHKGLLSDAYLTVQRVMGFAERQLNSLFASIPARETPTDLTGIADLDSPSAAGRDFFGNGAP